MKLEEILLWQQQTSTLNRNLMKCVKEIASKRILVERPPNFESKIEHLKDLMVKQDPQEVIQNLSKEHKQVFSYLLEEKQSHSLNELSEEFNEQFGASPELWKRKIPEWAFMTIYSSELAIWSTFENQSMHYLTSPSQIGLIRSFRKRAQQFITTIEKLIKKISKLKVSDSAYALDDLYLKFHKEKKTYQVYVKKFNIHEFQPNEEATITLKSKKQAEKSLFRYPKHTETREQIPVKQSVPIKFEDNHTLAKFNFVVPKAKSERKQSQQEIQRKKYFQDVKAKLASIGRAQQISASQLKDQLAKRISGDRKEIRQKMEIDFDAAKQQARNDCIEQSEQEFLGNNSQQRNGNLCEIQHYCNIRIGDSASTYGSYLQYVNFPITRHQFVKKIEHLANPLKKAHTINYEIASEDEYLELKEGYDEISSELSNQSDQSDLDDEFIDSFIDQGNRPKKLKEDNQTSDEEEEDYMNWGLNNLQKINNGEEPVKWQAQRGDSVLELARMVTVPGLSANKPLKMKRQRKRKTTKSRARNGVTINEENLDLSFESTKQENDMTFEQNKSQKSNDNSKSKSHSRKKKQQSKNSNSQKVGKRIRGSQRNEEKLELEREQQTTDLQTPTLMINGLEIDKLEVQNDDSERRSKC